MVISDAANFKKIYIKILIFESVFLICCYWLYLAFKASKLLSQIQMVKTQKRLIYITIWSIVLGCIFNYIYLMLYQEDWIDQILNHPTVWYLTVLMSREIIAYFFILILLYNLKDLNSRTINLAIKIKNRNVRQSSGRIEQKSGEFIFNDDLKRSQSEANRKDKDH